MAPLFWRVFMVNGALFVLASTVLALSPATVSAPPVRTEVVVLAIGLVAMLAINAVLLRFSLAPLDRLMSMMATVDLLRPGQRLPEEKNGDVAPLVEAFNAMLGRLEAERRASSSQALSAQEDERGRIARELHDEIGQSLTVVLLELKRAAAEAPDDLREELLQVQETTRASLEDVRRIARRLRPDLLEDLGLLAALTALTNEFSDLTGIAVHRTFPKELPALSEDVELVIYRVAQESLTNVARHSGATQAEVGLAHDGAQLLLWIRDDGCGSTRPEGAGIRGMRERALFVNGEIHTGSPPGAGTQVSLRIPDRT